MVAPGACQKRAKRNEGWLFGGPSIWILLGTVCGGDDVHQDLAIEAEDCLSANAHAGVATAADEDCVQVNVKRSPMNGG